MTLAIALVLSLGLNVATVTFSSVATLMSALVSAVSGASTVVSNLRRDANQKAAQVSSLSGELDTEKRRRAKLATDLKVKDQRIASMAAKLNNPRVAYRGQSKLLKEAVGDTVTRVSRRTAVAATRNVAAVFGEGIPVFGVGVAVAVTAYELKDGCDTLTDLRELELALDPDTVVSAEKVEACGTQVPSREEVWASVKSSPGDAWEGVQHYVPELPELGLETAWSATRDTVADGWVATREGASSAWDGVGEGAAAWRRAFEDWPSTGSRWSGAPAFAFLSIGPL
jgi:hypothetical protein